MLNYAGAFIHEGIFPRDVAKLYLWLKLIYDDGSWKFKVMNVFHFPMLKMMRYINHYIHVYTIKLQGLCVLIYFILFSVRLYKKPALKDYSAVQNRFWKLGCHMRKRYCVFRYLTLGLQCLLVHSCWKQGWGYSAVEIHTV